MPIVDRICHTCGFLRFDRFEHRHDEVFLCPNGHETERLWMGKTPAVIGDEIPGGLVVENLGDRPITVYSRSELKREMDARGLQPFVRHVPLQGSDKSPHTTNWSSMSQHTLDETKKLLERVTGDDK